MTATTRSAALVPIAPVFTDTERLALAGFLAGYSGLTRAAYELDLRQYASWCQRHQLGLFQARRAGIECFARYLEARGRARATITRRFCSRRLDRHGAARIVRRVARRAGITKPIGPHTLRHAFITAAERRGVATDASFPGKREDGAVRDPGPSLPAAACSAWRETAGQRSRVRTGLRRTPRCGISFCNAA